MKKLFLGYFTEDFVSIRVWKKSWLRLIFLVLSSPKTWKKVKI